MSDRNVVVAVVQTNARENVQANLEQAERFTRQAVGRKAELVVLPENFAYSGPDEGKIENAESVDGDGPILSWARKMASELEIHLLAGSVPEKSDVPDRVFNTSVLLNPDGKAVAVYRKIHLFEVNLPDRPKIRESDTLKAGTEVVVAGRPWGAVGLSICYDLRFPELYRAQVDRGAEILAIPAAFTDKTGEVHWELLVRARAVENLCFAVAANLCGHHFGERASWGHSLIVDPWGEVLAKLDGEPGVAVARLDMARVAECRNNLPALANRVL